MALQNINTMPVGVPISEVYLDPSYQNLGPFTVVRGGKKVTYSCFTLIVPLFEASLTVFHRCLTRSARCTVVRP